jgi:hypothetical protein
MTALDALNLIYRVAANAVLVAGASGNAGLTLQDHSNLAAAYNIVYERISGNGTNDT